MNPEQLLEEVESGRPPRLSRLLKRSPARDLEEVKAKASNRRESFLQDRTDRLAQRRQKHSQVLARGRVDVSAKLEALRESLSAAQVARSAIYARIAANGSKEVAKAQLVVQHNREKLRVEQETRRLALEVKLAEAEKRREIALHDRRFARRSISPRYVSSHGESMECNECLSVPKLSPDVAALRILKFWQLHVTRFRTRQFLALHLDYQTVSEIPFDVIADVIKGRDVMSTANALLRILEFTDHNNERGRNETVCRVFLATFMIVGHPGAILTRQGPLEARLIEEAGEFARLFTRWSRRVTSGRLCCQESLRASWCRFFSSFEAWKQDDSAHLVEIMVAQYCELDLIYQIVRNDSDSIVATEYHTAIKDNQLMLLSRIKGIAGDDTRRLLRAAVLAARRKRLPRRTKPASFDPAVEHTSQAPGNQAFKFFSLGQRQTRLSNRQLVHELALNSSFQISKPLLPKSEAALEDSMKNNFFESLQAEMYAGRGVSWIPIVVQECKMRLLRLVMPDSPTFKAITAAFDIPSVEAECRTNTYDYTSFTGIVIDMMSALCSPARDRMVADLKLLRGISDTDLFAKRINSIFEVLDVLLLDSANFHLRISAPRLIPEAVPYEQKMFAADVEASIMTIKATSLWLESSRGVMLEAAVTRDTEQVKSSRDTPPCLDIFHEAFVQLCTTESEIPETFHLDHERLSRYRGRTSRMIRIAAYIMAAKNLMRPKSKSLNPLTWTSLKDRLMLLISEEDDVEAVSIAAELNNHLDLAYTGAETDRAERHETLTRLLLKHKSSDPVQKLLLRRVQALMGENLRGTEISSTKIAAAGLDDFGVDLQTLLAETASLANLNWSCYSQWYHQILAK